MLGFRILHPLLEVSAPLFGTDVRNNFLVFTDAKSADEVNQGPRQAVTRAPVLREQRGQHSCFLHCDRGVDGGQAEFEVEQFPVDPGMVVIVRRQGAEALEVLDLRSYHINPLRV